MTVTSPQRLAILVPNWLGDAVMAIPAIADVRRGLPGSVVAIAARAAVAPLFALVDGVDEVLTIPSGTGDAARLLRDGRFDAVLLLPNSLHAAIIARRAGISERWGYGADLRSPLLTRRAARARGLHQVEYYQRLVRLFGFENGSGDPRITISADMRLAARTLLASRGRIVGAPLVAIAPGAAFGAAKRWPPGSFATLVASLAGDGVQAVMVGAGADRAGANAVLADLGTVMSGSHPPIDLVGATDLSMLAGVLTECRTLVTNDSGAMHVAAAAGVRVTAVFGPTNERETRPIGSGHAVVMSDVWCRPCMLRECPLDHQCMRSVSASIVLAATRRTL